MGNLVVSTDGYLPFVYLTNFLSDHEYEAILKQSLESDSGSDQQTLHLINLRNVNTWSVREQIERLYPLHSQRNLLKIKGGNVLAFYDDRGMDCHQDSVPNKDYPDDPEVGFSPNASAVYYLNDNYDGGEVCFSVNRPSQPQPAIGDAEIKNLFTLKPQPNSCLFFDANLWHWVRPVTSGKRFSSTYFLLAE
jgi:hypothetical protein